MIDRTIFSVSTDETRFTLSGVYINERQRVRCEWSPRTGIGWR
jgi:hypothetical protein